MDFLIPKSRYAKGLPRASNLLFNVSVFGCALTISLDNATSRKYTVPTEYGSRGDAKLAVALHAVEEGVLEFIRFRGGDPPDDYDRDTYEAKQTSLPKRPVKQASSLSNQHTNNDTLRRRKFSPTEDHRNDHRRSLDFHDGVITREEHYMDYPSRAGDRWDSSPRGGPHGPPNPYSYPDYPPGRERYRTAYPSPPPAAHDRDPSFMPMRRAVYSGTYHDLDRPTSSDRDVPQAYPNSYYWHDDERPSYPYWPRSSLTSESRDYPVLDYSADEAHNPRYSSHAPEPSMGAGDARYGSRSHSVSRASADHMSIGPSQAVPNIPPPLPRDLVMPERRPRSYVRPPIASNRLPSPYLHISKSDWTSVPTSPGPRQRKGSQDCPPELRHVNTELTHDDTCGGDPASTANGGVISMKDRRSRSRSTSPDLYDEVSLRERAKASRKRKSAVISNPDMYSRRWEKSTYPAH